MSSVYVCDMYRLLEDILSTAVLWPLLLQEVYYGANVESKNISYPRVCSVILRIYSVAL